ncbi:MAG: class I SAM-dependent methyltransferase [Planktomarina sp.]
MSFFDFLKTYPRYAAGQNEISRLNTRHRFIVAPFADDLNGARVLDLAAHDGRWSYALAGAGAASVEAVEGRADLVDEFAHYPHTDFKLRVDIKQGEVFAFLEGKVKEGATYDVIACYGFFYHITDHYRLLVLMRQLQPKLIIIDSEFMMSRVPNVVFGREKPDKALNSLAQVLGQELVMVGTPSRVWVNKAAQTLNYTTQWIDWDALPENDRAGVSDYFRTEKKRRGTVALRPRTAQTKEDKFPRAKKWLQSYL